MTQQTETRTPGNAAACLSDYDKAHAACMAVHRIVMNLPPKESDADALLYAYELLSQCRMEARR